jgi:hypothetical protein
MYQLVLQFPGDSRRDVDVLVAVEDLLIKELASEHSVDGHDIGSGQMNIFIHSENPEVAFSKVRQVIPPGVLAVLRVAYRELSTGDYIMLWPPGATGPFEIR